MLRIIHQTVNIPVSDGKIQLFVLFQGSSSAGRLCDSLLKFFLLMEGDKELYCYPVRILGIQNRYLPLACQVLNLPDP